MNNPPNVQFSLPKKHSHLNAKDMLISIVIDIFFTGHVRMLGMIILLPAIKQLPLTNPLWKHLSNLNEMAHTVPVRPRQIR